MAPTAPSYSRRFPFLSPARGEKRSAKKKADALEHSVVFERVGLLVNGPPGTAELPFI
jgi:hypothetical protein